AVTVVSNGQYYYVCTGSGTTAAAPLSGLGAAISDGNATWSSAPPTWLPNTVTQIGQLVISNNTELAPFV
ncbi:MAG TPA: hypothetical protein VHX64_18510, partial [Caulobacteraceae bacterium]|nr:hypothetical protein [Caulobacteraceae bacterium]